MGPTGRPKLPPKPARRPQPKTRREVAIDPKIFCGLSAREARFVAEYLVDLNATQAAIRTGYRPNSADVSAAKLVVKARVRAAINLGVKQLLEAPLIEAAAVVREAFTLATSDVRAMFDECGNLKPTNEFGDDIARAVSSVKVTERVVKGEDGLPTVERTKEFRLWDKNAALQFLGRYHRLITTERVEVDATLEHQFRPVSQMTEEEKRVELVELAKAVLAEHEPKLLAAKAIAPAATAGDDG